VQLLKFPGTIVDYGFFIQIVLCRLFIIRFLLGSLPQAMQSSSGIALHLSLQKLVSSNDSNHINLLSPIQQTNPHPLSLFSQCSHCEGAGSELGLGDPSRVRRTEPPSPSYGM